MCARGGGGEGADFDSISVCESDRQTKCNRAWGDLIASTEMRVIVVHMGSGISVSAHQNGHMIDNNNGEEGPFGIDQSNISARLNS